MFPLAVLSGFMGALDPGSNNNVFITMGVWFIISGILGLYMIVERYESALNRGLQLLAIGASFALFFYNPLSVIVSPSASESHQDMIQYLNSLDGPLFTPWLSKLQTGYAFSPAVHWVPMEDLIRGPGVNEYNHPNTRKLLDPVVRPNGTAYILMNYPLENDSLLGFLSYCYQLDTDLGDRFAALSTLPKRFNLEYPRYLYRCDP